MASTFFGLTIAYTGLQAAQTALNVTGHNISNINTEGYTKQQIVAQASDALRTHATYGALGAGITVTEITQTRDLYYDTKYRNNQSNCGQHGVKENYMTQIEDYLNEFMLEGFTQEYQNFFSAVNQLTMTPGDASSKNQLINNAKSFADYFNTLCTNLRNIQEDANNEVKDAVENINSYAKNIAAINKQINQIEACSGDANDLRDQRNAMLDELAEIVNISVSEESMGNGLTDLTVRINGQTLVSKYSYNTLEVVSRQELRNATDAAGLYDIQWNTGHTFDIYSDTLGGSLRGLIDLRDGCNGEIEMYAKDENGEYIVDSTGKKQLTTEDVLKDNTDYKGVPYYQAQMNEFVAIFSNAVNEILMSGYTSDGEHKGIPLFVTYDGTDTMTSANVTVNDELIENVDLLAIKKSVATGEANAGIMVELNKLETQRIFEGGTAEYYLESIISDMSIDAQKARDLFGNGQNLKTSIHNQRLSVMGVDMDEEAMSLMELQRAYSLNSKMLSVMNQIYDKLINGTGV